MKGAKFPLTKATGMGERDEGNRQVFLSHRKGGASRPSARGRATAEGAWEARPKGWGDGGFGRTAGCERDPAPGADRVTGAARGSRLAIS